MPSSVIAAHSYDEASRALTVRFVSGRRYVYEKVPPAIHVALTRARSKGTYFNAHIRDRFRARRCRHTGEDESESR